MLNSISFLDDSFYSVGGELSQADFNTALSILGFRFVRFSDSDEMIEDVFYPSLVVPVGTLIVHSGELNHVNNLRFLLNRRSAYYRDELKGWGIIL